MEQEQIKRGPGRPKYHEQVAPSVAVQEPVQASDTRRERPNRKPFGAMELTLAYPERPGFHRHWFNDVPARVSRALEAGYEHVKDNTGKNVNKVVGTTEGGQPLSAFLMEIPEEWYKEDMAAQQREIDAKEAAMKRGELESQPGDGRYVPAQGISIKHGN